MIDTVVMILERHEFKIIRPELFQPNCSALFDERAVSFRGRPLVKFYQNPTKLNIQNNVYMPRLTLERRPMRVRPRISLKVEFSAPKMLFNNNFDELVDENFHELLRMLKDKLFAMGVLVSSQSLKDAQLSGIHFSKNIPLTDFSSCSMVLDEIAQSDAFSRLDLNTTNYRNLGHALKYHANSFEVIFYDKLKDLQQAKISEKRSIEKENYVQMDIFDLIQVNKPFDVLRLEVRLNQRKKIKAMLRKLKITESVRFCDLYNEDFAQLVLKDFWEVISKDLEVGQIDTQDLARTFELMKQSNPKIRIESMLKLFTGLVLAKQIGLRGLRKILGFTGRKKTKWYRYKNQLKVLVVAKAPFFRAYHVIGACLEQFSPLRLADFKVKSESFE